MIGCECRQAELRIEPVASAGFKGERAFDEGFGRRAPEEDEHGRIDEPELRTQNLEPFLKLPGSGRAVLEAAVALGGGAQLNAVAHIS